MPQRTSQEAQFSFPEQQINPLAQPDRETLCNALLALPLGNTRELYSLVASMQKTKIKPPKEAEKLTLWAQTHASGSPPAKSQQPSTRVLSPRGRRAITCLLLTLTSLLSQPPHGQISFAKSLPGLPDILTALNRPALSLLVLGAAVQAAAALQGESGRPQTCSDQLSR